MARETTHRWKLEGELVALDPIHIGGVGTHPLSDSPLARDGQGRLYIPGTSLAGAVRSLAKKALGDQGRDALFGSQERDRGHASFILVEDAVLSGASEPELRQGVGIDRETGTAADKIKYDREVLPVGARFGLEVILEGPAFASDGKSIQLGIDQVRGIAVALKERLEKADGVLTPFGVGAGKTRGLGRLKLENAELREWDLGTPEGILDLALGSRGSEVAAPSSRLTFAERERWSIRVHWTQGSPVYMKSDFDGFIVDTLPVVTQVQPPSARGNARVAFVLSGAGIKGVLRSHAERIVRTVKDIGLTGDFLQQVKVPLVNALFGEAGDKGKGGRRGALYVRDCRSEITLDQATWDELTLQREGDTADPFREFNDRLRRAGLETSRIGHHVAIDRWTGGAADGLLFSVLETHDITWHPIELLVDVEWLPEPERRAALALLCLVLRDLGAGWLPLGFGGNRGMGEIAVTQIEVDRGQGAQFVSVDDPKAVLPALDLLRAVDDEGTLADAWTAWVIGEADPALGNGSTKESDATAAEDGKGKKGQGKGSQTAGQEVAPPPPHAEAFQAGPARWKRGAVGLEDALSELPDGATGIFYTPSACRLARRIDGRWWSGRLEADQKTVAEEALPLASVYEARAFDGVREVRWRQDGASGVAAMVVEGGGQATSPGAGWEPVVTARTTHRIDRQQLLWGEVRVPDGAWSVVHEERVGPHAVPFVAANGARLGITTREYIAVKDTGLAEGNAYVAEERLVGFTVMTP